jgi:threonyl-tRNA synthetase
MTILDELKAQGLKTGINPGEGAFYGPKLEYTLRDAIGREWQCGTTQVDFNLPGRFGAFYISANSEKTTPVMIHRAMFGSLERFTGILIEHYAGHLPLWLSPLQAIGLKVEGDLSNEKINYKVREHSLAKVPVLLVVGKKEAAERTVSIRRLGSQDQKTLALDEALAMLVSEARAPDEVRAGSLS